MTPSVYVVLGGPEPFRAEVLHRLEAHFQITGVTEFEPTRTSPQGQVLALPDGSVDYLFSIASPHVVSESVLEGVSQASINFHPGPPEYPGVGSVTRALLDGVDHYGVTAHHMQKVPDTGDIIDVERFSMPSTTTHAALTAQTYEALIRLVERLSHRVAATGPPLGAVAEWVAPPMNLRSYNTLLFEPDLAQRPISRVSAALPEGRFYGSRDLLSEVMLVAGAVGWSLGVWRALVTQHLSGAFMVGTACFASWLVYASQRGWRAGGGPRWTREHARLSRVIAHLLGRDPLLERAYARSGSVKRLLGCPKWLRMILWAAWALLLTEARS